MALGQIEPVAGRSLLDEGPARQVGGRGVAAFTAEDAAFGIGLDIDLAFRCFKVHGVSSLQVCG